MYLPVQVYSEDCHMFSLKPHEICSYVHVCAYIATETYDKRGHSYIFHVALERTYDSLLNTF